ESYEFLHGYELLMADLKQLTRRIFHETLAAIDIPANMRRKLMCVGTWLKCADAVSSFEVDLATFNRAVIVAIGKASNAMVDGLVTLVGEARPLEGIVSAPVAPARPVPGIRYFVAGHPLPNESSCAAASAILELLRGCDER